MKRKENWFAVIWVMNATWLISLKEHSVQYSNIYFKYILTESETHCYSSFKATVHIGASERSLNTYITIKHKIIYKTHKLQAASAAAQNIWQISLQAGVKVDFNEGELKLMITDDSRQFSWGRFLEQRVVPVKTLEILLCVWTFQNFNGTLSGKAFLFLVLIK